MNICVTGALGHIGSYLIRNLGIQNLNKVYLVDNLLTQRYASLFDLPDRPQFHFREIDIFSPDLGPIIEDCDYLIHLAAITNAEKSVKNIDEVENVNKQGLKRVAKLCAKHDCGIIFPSSTSVYGSQAELVDEDCPADELKPQSPYADSKLYAENLLKSLGEFSGLKYVVLRLGTIFGFSIGMRFHTAVNKFTWQAVMGQPITVWETAYHQKRPYCGLKDCITAINLFIAQSVLPNDIFNIVTSNHTVNEIVQIIKESVPGLKIEFVKSPIMNQLSYEVSNRKSCAQGMSYEDAVEVEIKNTIHRLGKSNQAF